jgi:hypothetical protein
MDWKKERDELIAQTLAFVQSVNAQLPEAAQWELGKPELGLFPAFQPPPARLEPEVSALPLNVEPEPPVRPNALAPGRPQSPQPGPVPSLAPSPVPSASAPAPSIHSEVEQEFRTRVASFRAHQERFNRERAEYFDATIARLRATLQGVPSPGHGQIAQPRD